MIKAIAKISRDTFLLSAEMLYDFYQDQGINNLHRSQVLSGRIREAGDNFDLIILPLYDNNIQFQDMKYLDILRDTQRLLTDNGVMLIIHLNKIKSDDNNYFLSHFVSSLNKTKFYSPFDEEDIIKDINSLGLEKQNSVYKNGVNYILIRKGNS